MKCHLKVNILNKNFIKNIPNPSINFNAFEPN